MEGNRRAWPRISARVRFYNAVTRATDDSRFICCTRPVRDWSRSYRAAARDRGGAAVRRARSAREGRANPSPCCRRLRAARAGKARIAHCLHCQTALMMTLLARAAACRKRVPPHRRCVRDRTARSETTTIDSTSACLRLLECKAQPPQRRVEIASIWP
jgi:hypothetical protein